MNAPVPVAPQIVTAPPTQSEAEFVAAIVAATNQVTAGEAPLHTPEIAGNEWAYVKECLDTEWISTAGSFVDRFEREIETITGAAHAIATINGTAALHAGLLALGAKPDDEVLVPALTFAGSANAIAHAGAHPHFIDIEMATLGLDPAKLEKRLAVIAERWNDICINRETGRPIRAVMAVHIFGHPCRIDKIIDVAAHWGLPVIEDTAESLGSFYQGRHTGTFGRLGALSFNGNKIVTAGGGGCVITDDAATADQLRHLTTTAKQPHRWEFIHDAVGYNYRLPNINAALGCAQLERLENFLARKAQIASAYRAAFASLDGVSIFEAPKHCRSNYWLNVILLDEDKASMRDPLLAAFHDQGIEARPAWRPLHLLAPFADAPKSDLDCSEQIYRRLINLPSSPRLADRF